MANQRPGPMDKPTGPSGILSSNRPMRKIGGKRTLGGSKGITASPAVRSGMLRSLKRGR